MEQATTYYELRHEPLTPGIRYNVFRGMRKTKDEWIAMNIGFTEDDFSGAWPSLWFSRVDVRPINVQACVRIISRMLEERPTMGLGATLRDLERRLRAMEEAANDVAKAYGLRCAADIIKAMADAAPPLGMDDIEKMVEMASHSEP